MKSTKREKIMKKFLFMATLLTISSHGWAADKKSDLKETEKSAPKEGKEGDTKTADTKTASKEIDGKMDSKETMPDLDDKLDVALGDTKLSKDPKDSMEEIQTFISSLISTLKAFKNLEKPTVEAFIDGIVKSLEQLLKASEPQTPQTT